MQLAHHVVGGHTRLRPDHQQVIEQVGAFKDEMLPVALHGGDDGFNGFLAQLLGGLGDAVGEELCSIRDLRIRVLAGHDLGIEIVEG